MSLISFLILALCFEPLHAWEEYRYAFKNSKSSEKLTGLNFGPKLSRLSQAQSNLVVYKLMMFIMLALIALFMAGGGWRIAALLILGGYFTYQLHHVLEAIIHRKYNPGLVTALLWVPVIVLWWVNFWSFL